MAKRGAPEAPLSPQKDLLFSPTLFLSRWGLGLIQTHMTYGARQPPSVSILFRDSDVASIFAELLEAQGAAVSFLCSAEQLSGKTRIVTEPLYFPNLSPEQYGRCLIVGNRDAVKDLPTLSLARPLTEENVEKALSTLMLD